MAKKGDKPMPAAKASSGKATGTDPAKAADKKPAAAKARASTKKAT